MKRISQSDLQNLYEPVSGNLEAKIDRVISSLDDGEERIVVKKKISVSFVLAAVLIIAGMVAFAAGKLDLFRFMTNVVEPILPLEGAEDMVVTDIGGTENEHVAVNVEEAVFDGGGIMTLTRISPKDIENYAMLNTFMQDTPEEIYDVRLSPAEAAIGEMEFERDGNVYLVVNTETGHSMSINGESAEFPASIEEAEAAGIPLFVENDTLYYADQNEFEVLGRKDGRGIIGWWLSVDVLDEETGKVDDSIDGTSMDAEEQPDGSVLVWTDIIFNGEMRERVKLRVRCGVEVSGEKYELSSVTFDLEKSEPERSIMLMAEDGKIGENIVIHSAQIDFTKVRGYLTVEYSYISDSDDMGIFFRVLDGEGNRITDGSGTGKEISENRYVQYSEIQSMEELPDTLILEAKEIGGDAIGRFECGVSEN